MTQLLSDRGFAFPAVAAAAVAFALLSTASHLSSRRWRRFRTDQRARRRLRALDCGFGVARGGTRAHVGAGFLVVRWLIFKKERRRDDSKCCIVFAHENGNDLTKARNERDIRKACSYSGRADEGNGRGESPTRRRESPKMTAFPYGILKCRVATWAGIPKMLDRMCVVALRGI